VSYLAFGALYTGSLPLHFARFAARVATRFKEVFSKRETILSDRNAEERLKTVAELEFKARNYATQAQLPEIIQQLAPYRNDASPVVRQRASSALSMARRLANGAG
jgi:hypothetical protein